MTLTPPGGISRSEVFVGDPNERYYDMAVVDSAAGFLYIGDKNTPANIIKIRLSDYTRVGTLPLNPGENELSPAVVIDAAKGFMYVGTRTDPGRIVKIRLSDFTRVDAITLNAGEDQLWSAALDSVKGYAYFGTRTVPGRIVKIRLSDFTRVGAITLATGEDDALGACLDSAAGFAYFGLLTYPGKVVKIKLSDFTKVGTLTFNSGEDRIRNGLLDSAKGYAYFGLKTSPGKVVRVKLSNFTRDAVLTMNAGEDQLYSGVIDPANGYAYFGTYTNPGIVVKVKLADFTRADAVTLGYEEKLLDTAAIDSSSGFAYFTTDNWTGKCVKINLNNVATTWTHSAPLKISGNLSIGAGVLKSSITNYKLPITNDQGLMTNDQSLTNDQSSSSVQSQISNPQSSITNITPAITVSGDWSNAGTYNPGLSTVVLDGANQRVSGANTFHNLTKIVTPMGARASCPPVAAQASSLASQISASPSLPVSESLSSSSLITHNSLLTTLTFESNKTQQVAGLLNLKGVAGNLLSLRASVAGKPWRLVSQHYTTTRYADIKDTNASEGQSLVALCSKNSGNNRNVLFSAPAQVTITTPTTSVTNPAWVEGTNRADVFATQDSSQPLTVSVNGGPAFAATRLTPTQWFANNSCAAGVTVASGNSVTGISSANSGANISAEQLFYNGGNGALGVTLSATAATKVTVTASNPFGETSTITKNITWATTDIKGKSFSSDTLRIRKGDSLLLTASGPGKKLEIATNINQSQNQTSQITNQPSNIKNQTSKIVFAGAPGNRYAHKYDEAGTYIAQAWIDGVVVGSLTVVVIEVNMNKDLAAQVFFERVNDVTKDMTINGCAVGCAGVPPASSSSSSSIPPSPSLTVSPSPIWFGSNDATLLKAFTTTDSKSGVTSLHLKPLKRGEQYVMARLGGATGPLLAMRKVWEFTLDTSALLSVAVDEETGIGTTMLTVHPLIPNVDFNFEMAGHTSTFAGGAKAFKVNTSAAQSSIGEPGFQAVWDEATGETIGEFSFDLEMPAAEDKYCFTLQPTQDDPEEVGPRNLKNGKKCTYNKFFIENDNKAPLPPKTSDTNLTYDVNQDPAGKTIDDLMNKMDTGILANQQARVAAAQAAYNQATQELNDANNIIAPMDALLAKYQTDSTNAKKDWETAKLNVEITLTAARKAYSAWEKAPNKPESIKQALHKEVDVANEAYHAAVKAQNDAYATMIVADKAWYDLFSSDAYQSAVSRYNQALQQQQSAKDKLDYETAYLKKLQNAQQPGGNGGEVGHHEGIKITPKITFSEIKEETGLICTACKTPKVMNRYSCTVKTLDYDVLASTITLPNWVESDIAGPKGQQAWDNFLDALTVHEEGHREIYNNSYRVPVLKLLSDFWLLKFVVELHLSSDPKKQAEAIRQAKEQIKVERQKKLKKLLEDIAKLKTQEQKDQDAYETLTDHGKTQDKHNATQKNTVLDKTQALDK